MINLSCPHCQKKLKVKAEASGKRFRCPQCLRALDVPLTSQPASTDPSCPVASSQPRPHAGKGATLPAWSPRSAAPREAPTPPVTPPPSDGPPVRSAPGGETTDDVAREVVQGVFAYELDGEIARGGMGAILRAVDQDIRRVVAVKFLLNQGDDRLKRRFFEEARITGQLEHPNIVPVHQVGMHQDGRCFFSMKMVKGRSLADILDSQAEAGGPGEYTLVRLLNVFTGVCNGIAYAHSSRVIHRDLKPANVMVGDFGEVYVMDWGLAKVLGQESGEQAPSSGGPPNKAAVGPAAGANLTQAGTIMGTPAYMPPEQALGQAVDERTDIYSLGAILYEILTLSPPPGREGDHLNVLMRVVEGEIPAPEKRAPDRARQGLIPPELSAVALKALAKDSGDRYQTVEALQRDIRLYLEGRGVSAKRDTGWETIKKLVRRNKGASLASAAALLLLTGGAGAAFYFIDRERDEAVAARDEARDNYNSFKGEQEKRIRQGRDSIPSLLTAGRLLLEKRDFDGARAQVRVALGFDPDHAELRFLSGQLALVAEDFPQAREDLEFYARQRPDDPFAGDLLAFLPKATANDTSTRVLLAGICTRHLAYPLADGVLQSLGANAPAAREKLLGLYRDRLNKNERWRGKGKQLFLDQGSGTFRLEIPFIKDLSDLSPLRGIPLSRLNLMSCLQVGDLEPLKGMPLTWLNLYNCREVRDLTPLGGMPLRFLNLYGCPINDLRPLEGMPLAELRLNACAQVQSLEPLRGMPLTHLNIGDCPRVRDLRPLEGLKITRLELYNSYVTDLTPLKGMKLESLDLRSSAVVDVGALEGMPLTSLVLIGCKKVRDLKPLRGMPLRKLFLEMSGVTDLTPLQGMKLEVVSLTPARITTGLDVLRRMETLKSIGTSNANFMPPAEFWKRQANGELK